MNANNIKNFNLTKDSKILIIVESPNKKQTIAGYLKKAGYKHVSVMASVGHIQKLENDDKTWKNTGIHVDDHFKLNLKVASEKKKTVADLTMAASNADIVMVATDPDREGHVISWSLLKFVKLDPNKTFRMVTHEITQKALVYALENPIPFNNHMVDAGLSRAAADKLIGFGITPWARNYVGAKSVGRCQSAGLIMIYEREKKIRDFKPETYYDLYLDFSKNKTDFRAKYYGTSIKQVDHFTNKLDAESVIKSCANDYKIVDISKREKKENPKPPFDTPSFQQEASAKMNLKVADAQSCAQKLFEGIEVAGQHVGLVTYIRTDDTSMSPEFLPVLKDYIESTYGKNMYNSPRVAKKAETSQEGHECLRCTDPSMTPEKLSEYVHNDLLIKVYRLIWQRTIASALPPATISETTYTIDNNGQLFTLVSNEILDLGYRQVYSYKDDDSNDDGPVKETFKVGEVLKNTSLDLKEKTTQPPARYKEATFIKALKDNEIGRPSTYNTILSTILDPSRNYCKLDGKDIIPTELGMTLAEALKRCYPDIMSLTYTKDMEKQLDLIADGKLDRLDFLNSFFKNLTESIDKNSEGESSTEEKICPKCGGKVTLKKGRFGKFYGCSNYPNCTYTEKYNNN